MLPMPLAVSSLLLIENGKNNVDIVAKADVFAEAAHCAVGQLRKYGKEDYIVHPRAVLRLLEKAEGVTDPMRAGALLHDVLEDTKVKKKHLLAAFGHDILRIVMGLTDVTTKDDGTREERKAIERAHLDGQAADVLTIKIADCIHNGRSIISSEPGFAKVYIPEIEAMLPILQRGDATLFAELKDLIKKYHEKVKLELKHPPKKP